MNKSLPYLYSLIIFGLMVWWVWDRTPDLLVLSKSFHLQALIYIIFLYLISHFLRMMRLILLTLDERNKVFSLVTAHAISAFPSSFLPFKVGEFLRLALFFRVYGIRQKALAVWLAERFGDIFVLTIIILGLYFFQIRIPAAVELVLAIFMFVSLTGVLFLFAINKLLIYLNRHLMLVSLSSHGLLILKSSNLLRGLERAIYQSIKHRVSGFILLSVLIWFFEILALILFMDKFYNGNLEFSSLFSSSLLSSISIDPHNSNIFGIYQSLALILLTSFFLVTGFITARLRFYRI